MPNGLARILVAVLASALGAGCATEPLALTVEGARDLGPELPGYRLLGLDVSLENHSETPVPFTYHSFLLQDRGAGAPVRSGWRTHHVDDSCAPTSDVVELAPRSRLTCTIAFRVPEGFEPIEVDFYSFAAELGVTAPVSVGLERADAGG